MQGPGATVDGWIASWRDAFPRLEGMSSRMLDEWRDEREDHAGIRALAARAGSLARRIDKGVITHAKNVFVPVSRRCANACTYCNFTRETSEQHADLFPLAAIRALARDARRTGCTEVLLCGGERADALPAVRAAIQADDVTSGLMVDWLVAACDIILDHDLLPHVNVGLLDGHELERLKPRVASMGLMLESTNPALPAHASSPGKEPAKRLAMIEAAGERHIPFTSGLLVGIGESMDDFVASLEALRRVQSRHGHLQEIIIQGLLPGDTTTTAGTLTAPGKERLLACVALARIAMPPEVAIQVPPNLVGTDRLVEFLQAGASDIGGISPVTPDHVNPGAPWPAIENVARILAARGFTVVERLPVYPRFLGAGTEFVDTRVRRVAERLINPVAGSR